ncbi:SHOCT domain-containing protein [Blastococcus litoris]|uniref:SHOCT domain-containing protein n=1 Tax=Blastococcus litoris TaxID=2171622 RepID=UPI0013E01125|nr:SHOCT domain-containing protein [Blastococcus litoris]
MTSSEPRSAAVRVRAFAVLGVGVAAGAAAITILSDIMRSVGAVGGSCADGGPYVSAPPCPDGTGTAMLLVLGLAGVCLVGTLWGAHVLRAPQPVWLGWPALFLVLGWNFLEDGLVDPPEGFGVNGGYVFCGVLFVAMGAGPLFIVLWALKGHRRDGWQPGPAPVVVHRRDLPESAPPPGPLDDDMPSGDLPGGDAPPRDDPRASAMSVAGRLERLAALHASGELTDEEYRLAKQATLREETAR